MIIIHFKIIVRCFISNYNAFVIFLLTACVLGLISGITGPILRGIMSKSVDETEQGNSNQLFYGKT